MELLQVLQEELLQGESTTPPLFEQQEANPNSNPETIASTYSSLKTQLAALEKMTAN